MRFDLVDAAVAFRVPSGEAGPQHTLPGERQVRAWSLPLVVFWGVRQALLECEPP